MSIPILVVLLVLRLTPHSLDHETPLERTARALTYGRAIDAAVTRATCDHYGEPVPDCRPLWHRPRLELALWLLALAYSETRLARHVHAGKCRPWECGGRPALWVSSWQIAESPLVPRRLHRQLAGLDLEHTTRAATTAARIFARAWHHCRENPLGAIALYATGNLCEWEGSHERWRLYDTLQTWADDLRQEHRKPLQGDPNAENPIRPGTLESAGHSFRG